MNKTGITREKIENLRHSIGDNSPAISIFCENCDDFVNDWDLHRKQNPFHIATSYSDWALNRILGKKQKKIVVYSEDWCEPCQKLKAWLKEKGLEFEERKPPEDNPRFVVLPYIKIGRWVVKGFSPEKIEEMLKRD